MVWWALIILLFRVAIQWGYTDFKSVLSHSRIRIIIKYCALEWIGNKIPEKNPSSTTNQRSRPVILADITLQVRSVHTTMDEESRHIVPQETPYSPLAKSPNSSNQPLPVARTMLESNPRTSRSPTDPTVINNMIPLQRNNILIHVSSAKLRDATLPGKP